MKILVYYIINDNFIQIEHDCFFSQFFVLLIKLFNISLFDYCFVFIYSMFLCNLYYIENFYINDDLLKFIS